MRILSVDITGAEERTRTSTPLLAHEPESCASTNSATSAPYFSMTYSLGITGDITFDISFY